MLELPVTGCTEACSRSPLQSLCMTGSNDTAVIQTVRGRAVRNLFNDQE